MKNVNVNVVNVLNDNGVYLATDMDFKGTKNGEFRYIGTAKIVEIPHVIKRVEVTSYQRMFEGTEVEKVISTNPNITDMSDMFENSKAITLNLSNFNTSNVENMRGMFSGSKAAILDLSSFNTSNVVNMSYMFFSSQAVYLNMLNFNTENVINMSYMFSNSKVKSLISSNFDTSNVINARHIFEDVDTTSLDLSNFRCH